MSARIDILPTELLDEILGYLSNRDLARLTRCSKLLNERVVPALYGSKTSLSKAMYWGCVNGNQDTISLAKTHGASISAVDSNATKRKFYWHLRQKVPQAGSVSTIQLAATKCQSETFRFLISLGARLDVPDLVANTENHLMTNLRRPINWDLLQIFLESGLGRQMKLPPRDALPLVPFIMDGASAGLVRLLLDHGAAPDQTYCIKRQIICPLSASILANSPSIFNLLIERGAVVHGISLDRPKIDALNIPIFAAATMIPKHGLALMQLCIDNGADINHRVIVRVESNLDREYSYRYLAYTTPLLVYLDSVNAWKPHEAFSPIDALEYFFNHGASVRSPGMCPELTPPMWPRRCEPMSPLRFLLTKWSLEHLVFPLFFETIELLIKKGMAWEGLHKLLVMYDLHPEPENGALIAAWQNLVSLFIKYQAESLDAILSSVIKEQYAIIKYHAKEGMSLGHAIITYLLAAGADINARTGDQQTSPLYDLCCSVKSEEEWKKPPYFDTESSCRVDYQSRLFFHFLVGKGADPLVSVNGRTAVEVLLEDNEKLLKGSQRRVKALSGILHGSDPGLPCRRGGELLEGENWYCFNMLNWSPYDFSTSNA